MVTLEEVRRIAKLAYFEFEQDNLPHLRNELNDILGYMDKLNQADTSDIQPFTFDSSLNPANSREDVIKPSPSKTKVLENSSHSCGDFFLVPGVSYTQRISIDE